MKRSIKTLAVVASLLAIVLPVRSSIAATGDVCDVPEFDFVWPDANNPLLVVEVEKPGIFSFEITGRKTDGKPVRAQVDRLQLYAGRNEISVDFAGLGFAFYLANSVMIHFEAWDGLQDAAGSDPKAGVCFERRSGRGNALVFEQQILKVDAGSVFSRNKDDGFDGALELAINATSRWTASFTGVVDVRLSEIGKIDDGGDSTSMGDPGPEDPMGGTEPMDGMDAPKVFNPFVEGGSMVRADAYAVFHPLRSNKIGTLYPPWSGVVGGFGFSTLAGDTESVEAKQRYFYGLRLQVLGYNRKKSREGLGGTTGYFQFGLARDDLWQFEDLVDDDGDPETAAVVVQRDERDRLFIEGVLEFPNLGTDTARMAVRLFADLPESGDGPADIRISVLAAINLKELGKAIGG